MSASSRSSASPAARKVLRVAGKLGSVDTPNGPISRHYQKAMSATHVVAQNDEWSLEPRADQLVIGDYYRVVERAGEVMRLVWLPPVSEPYGLLALERRGGADLYSIAVAWGRLHRMGARLQQLQSLGPLEALVVATGWPPLRVWTFIDGVFRTNCAEDANG